MAVKVKKEQREERMWLKRMAVTAVMRRVGLEGGDEAEEVGVGGRNGGGNQGGKRVIEGRAGVVLC